MNKQLAVPEQSLELVVRSTVPAGKKYSEYQGYLRHDFFYSCAYCTISEFEAQAIRFVIDHYEPREARRDLEHQYDNLMYACDQCNVLKGDRCPPAAARANGHRFFRPDWDEHSAHFECTELRIEPRTEVGYYSIHALDLNRRSLWRLRNIRRRLANCGPLVSEGIRGLRRFPIDELPQHVRARALSAIRRAEGVARKIDDGIDALLRTYARSDVIDSELDPGADVRAAARAAKLSEVQAFYPGSWRARKSKRKQPK